MAKLFSIIVPVYNVEQYIRPCVQSIFNQGLTDEDFEVILVNDGTKDNSFGQISDIIESHFNIIVIEQENQGLSVARNNGLLNASGEYILFVDSDDLLIKNSLRVLLQIALKYEPDLLISGFRKMTDEEIANGLPDLSSDFSFIEKKGEQVFTGDLNPRQCYVWRTIYKKAFLNNNAIRFIPGIYFEDVPYTTDCLLKAGKCIITNLQFYIYRQRLDSIVSSINVKKLKDMNQVVATILEKNQSQHYSKDISNKLMDIAFTTFSIALWYITHDKLLLKERKIFINDLNHRVPKLAFTHGIKQRTISFIFSLFPNTYIKIRAL